MRKATGTKTLKTERLTLRKILPTDYFSVVKWYTNPEIAHFMMGKRPFTKKEVLRFTVGRLPKYRNKRYYYWAIVYKGTMRGLVQLMPVPDRDNVFALHYKLDMNLKNQGITTEAVRCIIEYCKTQDIAGLIAMCDEKNIGSRRVMEKSGMIPFGNPNTNAPYVYADGTTGRRIKYKIKF